MKIEYFSLQHHKSLNKLTYHNHKPFKQFKKTFNAHSERKYWYKASLLPLYTCVSMFLHNKTRKISLFLYVCSIFEHMLSNFCKKCYDDPQNSFVNNSVWGFKNAEFDTGTESVISASIFFSLEKWVLAKKYKIQKN